MNQEDRKALVSALEAKFAGRTIMDRTLFRKDLKAALRAVGAKTGAPVQKAIESALGTPDEDAEVCLDKDGNPEPDPQLRDHELVPLSEDWREYMVREVMPFVPDAWVDEGHTDDKDKGVGRVGYEINFNRYFYNYTPPRAIEAIDSDLKSLEAEIACLLQEVV